MATRPKIVKDWSGIEERAATVRMLRKIREFAVIEQNEAINDLLQDRELRKRMRAAGRRRVENLFSWSAIAQDTLKLYQEIAGQKG